MAEHVRVLLTEEDVDRRIQEIGDQISRDYEGKQVHLICVLKGGSFFMCAEGRFFLYVRTGKEDYGAGISGFYVGIQLWKCN